MKKLIISMILICFTLSLDAQIYTPSGTIQGTSSNNNIGIGTASPSASLHIRTSTADLLIENSGIEGAYMTIHSGRFNRPALTIYKQAGTTYWQTGILYDETGNQKYSIGTSISLSSSKLTIQSDGNIGIGTTAPASRLHIGCGNNDGILIGNYNDQLDWDGTSSQPGYHIRFAGYRDIVSNFTGARISALRTNQCCGGLAQGMELSFSVSQGAVAAGDANLNEAMRINSVGNIGIGTINPTYKLDVVGTIRAREIKVDINGADFVFEKDYKLMPLSELELFIKVQKHLPEVAPAKEMKENGTDLGNLNSKLLQKMEEMTLYIIEQNKKIIELEKQNVMILALKEKIEKLETALK